MHRPSARDCRTMGCFSESSGPVPQTGGPFKPFFGLSGAVAAGHNLPVARSRFPAKYRLHLATTKSPAFAGRELVRAVLSR